MDTDLPLLFLQHFFLFFEILIIELSLLSPFVRIEFKLKGLNEGFATGLWLKRFLENNCGRVGVEGRLFPTESFLFLQLIHKQKVTGKMKLRTMTVRICYSLLVCTSTARI